MYEEAARFVLSVPSQFTRWQLEFLVCYVNAPLLDPAFIFNNAISSAAELFLGISYIRAYESFSRYQLVFSNRFGGVVQALLIYTFFFSNSGGFFGIIMWQWIARNHWNLNNYMHLKKCSRALKILLYSVKKQ